MIYIDRPRYSGKERDRRLFIGTPGRMKGLPIYEGFGGVINLKGYQQFVFLRMEIPGYGMMPKGTLSSTNSWTSKIFRSNH